MFERYTEKARRTVFFARYEASQLGSAYIEAEHLLLGILREDKDLTQRFLRSHASVESIRRDVQAHTTVREKVSTSVDLPLADQSKRVLKYAVEEADQLGNKQIGTEHLFLGLLREKTCFAAELLTARDIHLAGVREELRRIGVQSESSPRPQNQLEPDVLAEFSRNLTAAALDGELDPLIGRDSQIGHILQILARRHNRNAVLLGPPGVGKKTIVAGLAQRIAEGSVPNDFQDLLIVELHLPQLTHSNPRVSTERVQQILCQARAIFVLDELHIAPQTTPTVLLDLLKPLIVSNQIRCLSIASPSAYDESVQRYPWLQACFQTVSVPPATEAETLEILRGLKPRFEKFHGITYSDDALIDAARLADKLLPGFLPGKAVSLLDESGTPINLKPLPEEIRKLQKLIRFIAQRMQSAIANHEFEKARFYSEEERKEREKLKLELEKSGASASAPQAITSEQIRATVSRMTGLSPATIEKMFPPEPS